MQKSRRVIGNAKSFECSARRRRSAALDTCTVRVGMADRATERPVPGCLAHDANSVADVSLVFVCGGRDGDLCNQACWEQTEGGRERERKREREKEREERREREREREKGKAWQDPAEGIPRMMATWPSWEGRGKRRGGIEPRSGPPNHAQLKTALLAAAMNTEQRHGYGSDLLSPCAWPTAINAHNGPSPSPPPSNVPTSPQPYHTIHGAAYHARSRASNATPDLVSLPSNHHPALQAACPLASFRHRDTPTRSGSFAVRYRSSRPTPVVRGRAHVCCQRAELFVGQVRNRRCHVARVLLPSHHGNGPGRPRTWAACIIGTQLQSFPTSHDAKGTLAMAISPARTNQCSFGPGFLLAPAAPQGCCPATPRHAGAPCLLFLAQTHCVRPCAT
ncbi:hypothetical protein PMIN04_012460 [Paraphaeosphaeria minitans]